MSVTNHKEPDDFDEWSTVTVHRSCIHMLEYSGVNGELAPSKQRKDSHVCSLPLSIQFSLPLVGLPLF